jgi:hypothetical protein
MKITNIKHWTIVKKQIKLSETQLHNIILESVNRILNEGIEYDDYGAIADALEECGWAYSDSSDVVNRQTGQKGIRYRIEPYNRNLKGIKPCSAEEVKNRMIQLLGEENVVFSEGTYRYAPELKALSMVVLENGNMSESIEIKPENKGKFNATKKRTGKSTEELLHSKNPLTRKRANFVKNSKKWKH